MVVADGKSIGDGVVLILHGTLGHKDMEIIETLQSVFQEGGYSSLAITLSLGVSDRRGFYPCESRHAHQYGDAVGELTSWVEWLDSQRVETIALMAHSRGANQATKYVLSSDASVSSLVLLAPSANDVALDNVMRHKLGKLNPNDWLSGVEFLHCEDADVQVASYLSYFGPNANNNTVSLLADIKVPTLVISGSEDVVVGDLGRPLTEVENDAVMHLKIEGADHFFRDLYAYDVVDAVDSFLSEKSR